MSVQAHCSDGVSGSEGREGANGVRGGFRIEGGNGDGNEVRDRNGDVNGDGDEDRAGTGAGVEAIEQTKYRNSDRGDIGREQDWEWRPVYEHKMGTGTGAGAGIETRAVAETGTGKGMRTRTGTGTRSGRAEEGWRSTRNRTRGVDSMWETGKTWASREKHVDKKGSVQ